MEGNERTDELAKTGSVTAVSGPEPFIPVPDSLCAKALAGWVKEMRAECWKAYEGGKVLFSEL